MKAQVTTDGRRLLARIDYAGGRGPRAAKNIPGARADWDKSVTPNVFLGWSYALTMENCRALRKEFGQDLEILKPLADWAREQVAKENQLEQFRENQMAQISFPRVEAEAPALARAIENRSYQSAGTAFILAGKQVILGDDPGCISGDAMIKVNRNGITSTMSMRNLYLKFNDLHKRYHWNDSPVLTKSLNENGILRLNSIQQVVYKGISNTVSIVLENGKSLTCTPDHRILTSGSKWKRAGRIHPGDAIMCNGKAACKKCGSEENVITYEYAKFPGYCKSCMYRYMRNSPRGNTGESGRWIEEGYVFLSGHWDHPNARKGIIREHTLIMSRMIGRPLSDDEMVHHKNNVKDDNRPENLELMTKSEHAIHHGMTEKFINMNGRTAGKGGEIWFIPEEIKVASVSKGGKTDVYDITMDEDGGQNFVVNGMIVHNCGKTLQALAAVIENDARDILVACRRTATRAVWERETARWAPAIATFVAQGTRKEREDTMYQYSRANGRKMLIINIEMVRAKRTEICPAAPDGLCAFGDIKPYGHEKHAYKAIPEWPFLSEQEWDAIIFDESHNLLASTANVQSKRITQARFGAVQVRRQLRPGGLAIALSGTPFRSKVEKGWGTLNWLRPDIFTSYWNWAGIHFGVEDGRYGKVVGNGDKVLEPRDKEAWDRMLRPYYLKRTKSIVAPDLPPIQYAGTPIDPEDPDSPCYVQLEMDEVQNKMYWNMERLAEATLADGSRITATGVLAEITRLRQFATATHERGGTRQHLVPRMPSNKIEWLIDFMQERVDTGQKVVVASSFSSMVELAAEQIRKECNLEVLTLTGATSDRERSHLVARFQDPKDKLQVVAINRDAGGESITLDAADEMVVLDMPWISDRDEQLNARIHRVSRIHNVEIYRLVSTGTIDTWIASLNAEQRAIVETASPRSISEMAIAGREEK